MGLVYWPKVGCAAFGGVGQSAPFAAPPTRAGRKSVVFAG